MQEYIGGIFPVLFRQCIKGVPCRQQQPDDGRETVYLELPETEEDVLMETAGALCRRLDEIGHIHKVVGVVGDSAKADRVMRKLKKYYEKELECIAAEHLDGVVFRPCRHIKDVREDIRPIVWIDKYLNCVETQEDYEYVRAYPYLRDFFVEIHYEWLMQGILEERNRENGL